MPFSMVTFDEKIHSGHLGIDVDSNSLRPLLAALNAGNNGVYLSNQVEAIQEALAFLPHAKQTKYSAAIAYLQQEFPSLVLAIPCEPKMEFVEFGVNIGHYVGVNSQGDTKSIDLPVRSYHHQFRFSWKSSNGNLESLRAVGTREHVKFRSPPSGPPFNYVQADTPMEYTQGTSGSGGSRGSNEDDHSTLLPELICSYPLQAGSLIAEQWYQYTTNGGTTWKNIAQAAYLLEKGVRQGGDEFVYYFKKTNWPEHNRTAFRFEVEYDIWTPPAYMPKKGDKIGKSFPEPADIRKHARRVVAGA